MDSISSFDIILEKDVYSAGETISGFVIIETIAPIKIKGIRVFLRGRAKVQWKILKSGESRTIKDDHFLLDEKCLLWGKDRHESEEYDILPIGLHQLPFQFQLSVCQIPCSLETKTGSIRYHIKALVDIPHASSPQGLKYFTVIGPHVDCNEDKFTTPLSGQDHKVQCLMCCRRGIIALKVVLDRSAYCCGETLRMRVQIENRQDFRVCLYARLSQNIEYRIEKGSHGVEAKMITSMVLEHRSQSVPENCQSRFDYGSDAILSPIKIPVVPPTMVGVCRLFQVYYVLRVCLEDERKNQSLELDFPLTIGTIPYKQKGVSTPQHPVSYDYCVDYVETGRYISPEFRLGSVYDGGIEGSTEKDVSEVILYRPVYVTVSDRHSQ